MYSQHRGMETYKHKEKDIQIFFFLMESKTMVSGIHASNITKKYQWNKQIMYLRIDQDQKMHKEPKKECRLVFIILHF